MSNPADLVYTIAKEKLPTEWSLATISDLVGKDGVFVDGDWVESKDQDPDGDVRLIQLADIGDGEYRNRSERFLTHEKAIRLGCTFLEKGDVLIARMPDPLGRACIFPGDQKKSVTVVDVAIVRPAGNAFDARWLMYFVNAPAFRSAVSSMQSGSTRKRISRGNLSKIVLPVPPLVQQKRIVAEIEKQFSRLDEAVANLKRVKANLKRYKAAVLKAAVEGRLVETEAELARREGRTYETGAQLLQRILETRRSQWQGKGKYKEPAAPDTTGLPELPEGWVWASADQLMSLITDGEHITPSRSESGVLLLSARNVLNGQLDLSVVDYVPEEEHLRLSQRLSVMAGDVLLSCSGSVGRSCVVPNGAKFSLVRSVAVLRPVAIPADFVCYQIQSPLLQSQIATRKTQTAQANIFQGKIRQLVFALPPEDEQHRIVAEVDRRLSLADEADAQVNANLQRAARLRQSILANAFSGSISDIFQRTNDELHSGMKMI